MRLSIVLKNAEKNLEEKETSEIMRVSIGSNTIENHISKHRVTVPSSYILKSLYSKDSTSRYREKSALIYLMR